MRVRSRAARRLVRFSGLPLRRACSSSTRGAEANENALKVALRMTRREHVAAIEGGFHGRTAAAGGGDLGRARQVVRLSAHALRRAASSRAATPRPLAAHVTRKTAAVIVEPVQGMAGAVDLGAAFLAALRARCDEVGALLIFDEVQCGMGRTGAALRRQLLRRAPDLLTTAKALGNGFPCAALMMSPLVAASLKIEAPRHDLRRRPDGLRGRSRR